MRPCCFFKCSGVWVQEVELGIRRFSDIVNILSCWKSETGLKIEKLGTWGKLLPCSTVNK
jgi:hypothetical protein